VLRLFLKEASVVVLVGVMAGMAAALAGGRYMQSLLFGVSTSDAASVVTTVAGMLVVAAAATYVPARRAASVEPSVTLRG
jgi:ABC-type antimicrobial peptide transport system permease subunit